MIICRRRFGRNGTNRFGQSGTNGFGRFGTNGFRGRFGGGRFGLPRIVDWQNDAKNYEFWVHARRDGISPSPMCAPVLTRCTRSPTACWAIYRDEIVVEPAKFGAG